MLRTTLCTLAVIAAVLLPASIHAATDGDATTACLKEQASSRVNPNPNWRGLLPLLVFGVDYRHAPGASFRLDSHIFGRDQVFGPQVDHHLNDHLTRWTIGLRWVSRPPNEPADIPAHPFLSYCQELFGLRGIRPEGLAQAIDHWIRTETLRALLRAPADRNTP